MNQATTTEIRPTSCPVRWPRAIIHIDMNAFFASIEQRDHPYLRGKPVAITNGEQGSCIITCSYEARAYGIKTGMRLREARTLCSGLIRRAGRPSHYAEISRQIMHSLEAITPDLEIFSVDEAFLDVTHCQTLYGTPVRIARLAQSKITAVTQLPCSIGLSGDKTTAKYAANLMKPNGFTVIPPWEAKAWLRDVPVTALCGIGKGIGNFLARHGVYTCGDMNKVPIGLLAKRFGNLGRRLWFMCQGADPTSVTTSVAAPKSMGHGKVTPPNTTDKSTILAYFSHMSEKLSSRMRRHNLEAQHFFVGVRTYPFGWIGDHFKTKLPTHDQRELFNLCKQMLFQLWQGQGISQVQLTAVDPRPTQQQLDLFDTTLYTRQNLNRAVDIINARYGRSAIGPARLLNYVPTPNVIAPSFRPSGPRQTIDPKT